MKYGLEIFMTNKNNKVMKANAPDKIYLQEPTKVRTEKKYDNDVEYIRTDAFIEKAFEFFGEHLWEYIDVKNANCDTFINIDGDKLKEDFKNYMEESKV